jgi:hypothetical protein
MVMFKAYSSIEQYCILRQQEELVKIKKTEKQEEEIVEERKPRGHINSFPAPPPPPRYRLGRCKHCGYQWYTNPIHKSVNCARCKKRSGVVIIDNDDNNKK